MINFFFRKVLKWQKSWGLRAVLADMDYLRTFKGDLLLVSTEDKLRTELLAEKKKPNPDMSKIEKISDKIADAVATRGEYDKLKVMSIELPDYISML